MIISLIAAISQNLVIGRDNQLPWHLPADLKHFKSITWGKPIIMGRKTFESIGKALPGRENIVVTRQKDYQAEGCTIRHSLEEAISQSNAEEVMIIGGNQLFEQAMPLAHRLYLTVIHEDFEGDCFFPPWHQENWKVVSETSHEPDEKNAYHYAFLELQRSMS